MPWNLTSQDGWDRECWQPVAAVVSKYVEIQAVSHRGEHHPDVRLRSTSDSSVQFPESGRPPPTVSQYSQFRHALPFPSIEMRVHVLALLTVKLWADPTTRKRVMEPDSKLGRSRGAWAGEAYAYWASYREIAMIPDFLSDIRASLDSEFLENLLFR